MLVRQLSWLLVLGGLGLACTDSVDGLGMQGGSGSEGTSADESSTGTPQPDLGDGTDGTDETGEPDPCDKLDLLFVIDNTAANQVVAQQVTMLINILAGTLEANWDDFHVGVVRTNDSTGTCRQSGALSDHPDPMADPCSPAAGPYASHEDGDSLSDVLSCMTQLSPAEVPDSVPKAALATGRGMNGQNVGALDPEFDAIQSECNAGFIRPDAHHILVLIASDDDLAGEGSPGEPADWHDWLAGYDDAERLAIVDLIPRDAGGCPNGAATRLVSWLGMFSDTSDHDWCQLEPIPAFGALTAAIEGGCGP